jgi:FKBP-type peptidyl-prolyl cis-trans isomerase FklB
MKNFNLVKLVVGVWAGMAVLQSTAFAEDKPAFKDEKEKASYGVGMTFGNQIKRAGFEVDLEIVTAAMKDVLAGHDLRLTEQQARETIMAYQQEARKKTADKNKKEGDAFLAANLKKEGVKTHTVTLPDAKTADLQYRIITDGTGATPKSNDVVSVNYRGTLINGKEFDSSAKRGQPAKFAVNRVIKGWTEALQLMKVGSKWEVFIPSVLGYGDNGSGPLIEPGSTLIFEVELLGVEAPQQQPANSNPAQPLTSDIIRVPSAEELKKGAKIEVIKPDEAAKAAADAAKSQTK